MLVCGAFTYGRRKATILNAFDAVVKRRFNVTERFVYFLNVVKISTFKVLSHEVYSLESKLYSRSAIFIHL